MKNILKITIIIGFMFVLSSCWGDKTKPNFKNGMTSQCKDIFIGSVYQFENTDEYYINLFFNEGFEYKSSINTIMDNLDLLVFEDDGISRKRIKLDYATKYFNLKKLDTIYFYNNFNELIGSGIFKRAEYVDHMIQEDFIAVYKPFISHNSQKPFYASNCKISNKKTKWIKSENKDLENKIISTYNINRSSMLKIYHFTNYESNTTYSMVSYDYLKVTYDFPYLNSFIVKYKNGKLTKIYETGSDYILDDIFISAFTFNNNPIIIVDVTRPESDYFDTVPLFYDGEGYNFKKGDRSGSEESKEDLVTDNDLTNDKDIKIPKDAVKGDFNGDGKLEYMWLIPPKIVNTTGEEGMSECADGNCTAFIKFSDKSIPSIKINNCIAGIPDNLGDLNKDGTDEIGLLPGWFTSCWRSYYVWTLKNSQWVYAVQPFNTHCIQWDEEIKPIEIDLNKDGHVIIRYSEFTEEEGIITKTKSVPIK